MTEYARLVMSVDSRSANKATDDLRKLDAQSGKTERSAGSLAAAFKPLAAVFASFKVAQFIQETTLLGSRYNELGIVMEVVGRNAGYSRNQLDALESSLKTTGISAIESRNNIARMISANIDLAKATDLARLAQDAAVVGGVNSSEAFERLIRGIQSAEVETLRNIGINVSFDKSYEALAAQIGKTKDELTEQEKVQARVNGTLAAAPNLAGAYEASLDNAGKQLRSSTRYLEDLQVQLGQTFQPAFEGGVTTYAESLKFLSQNVDGVVQVLEAGLYVAIARGTTVIGTNTAALIAQAVQQARNNALLADAAAFELRKTQAVKAGALADLDKARASEAAAIATLAQARANQQLFALQVSLSASTAEYTALSRGLVLVDKELAIAEQAVATATAARTAAAGAAAAATANLSKATAASAAASTAAAASASVASRALTGVAAVGGRLLGLLGGPVGLALTVGAVALSFVDFSDDADDAKVSADALTGSVNKLGDAADMARARFAGLLGDVSNFNKAELQIRTTELESQLKNAEKQLKSFERQFDRGVGTQGQIEGAKAAVQTLRDELSRLGKEQAAQGSQSTKEGKRYVERLTEQRALLGAVTEQERIRAQIRAGTLKLSAGEEAQVLALAAEIDAYDAATKAAEDNARAGKQSSEEKRRASEQLLESYRSTEEALLRELALFGETTGAAQLRYDLEHGALSGINAERQAYLLGLQEELDKRQELKELDEEYQRIREQSMTAEQSANAEIQRDYAVIEEQLRRGRITEGQYREDILARADAYARAAEEGKKATDDLDEFAKNAIQSFQGSLGSTIKDTLTGDFDDIGDRWLDLLNQMAADALAAQLTRSLFGEAGGGAKGSGGLLGDLFKGSSSSGGGSSAGGLLSLFSSFAGFFDRGGPIGAGQFGIVGENGPEIVRGPANVTGREQTAKQMGSSLSIGQMVFPGVTNAKEAREASGVAARQLAKVVGGLGRYA
jgi:hypothetical protein